ncbi:Lacal_2735 family protein [Tamlana sp. 2201CG12-4]|uniref:Lacal_2735 family protein n=1 Tax=Tamlana sp. 2201CG12-4 TaxID=3112582 RepID=UPI002DB69FE0|nr:Lacal_2735 family protein [Tamlana sp. 2201CG12-4]MEC3907542.1 Lacal_2735 family protein [Tamlana sp. 2201CG12-4]
MDTHIKIQQNKIKVKYKQLIEQAYNFRQIDAALSDILEYQAMKLLNKLNGLKYLHREVAVVTI